MLFHLFLTTDGNSDRCFVHRRCRLEHGFIHTKYGSIHLFGIFTFGILLLLLLFDDPIVHHQCLHDICTFVSHCEITGKLPVITLLSTDDAAVALC